MPIGEVLSIVIGSFCRTVGLTNRIISSGLSRHSRWDSNRPYLWYLECIPSRVLLDYALEEAARSTLDTGTRKYSKTPGPMINELPVDEQRAASFGFGATLKQITNVYTIN